MDELIAYLNINFLSIKNKNDEFGVLKLSDFVSYPIFRSIV